MAGRIASLAMPLKLLVFLAGILLATLVLAILGVGSIEHEKSLTEKNYENAKVNFKTAVIENSKKETEAMIWEILHDSLTSGVLSVFAFKDGILLEPKVSEEKIGEVYILEKSEALVLKEFLDLQKAEKFTEAKEYALKKAAFFMQNPSLANLDWNSYFLEKMLSDILSKNLNEKEKKNIEKTLNETKKLLRDLDTYREHRDFLLALGNYAGYSNDGYYFIKHKEDFFLTISYPELPAKNAIVAAVDSAFYSDRMSNAIEKTAKEWSYIPYSISGEFPFGDWNVLIEDGSESIRKESQKKIAFLYLMLIFSLIIPIIGVVVVYRGFSRERQLRLMKDNFLSTVSHELKTPLTSVKMYSELMNSGRVQKIEKIVSYTGVILKETNRLENLIEDILNYTRMESGKKIFYLESINLSVCADKVCDSLEVIAKGKGLEIKREIADNCAITGDYASIYSLVQNLVDNAIKYTVEGHVFIKLQQGKQEVSLSVADTGRGIPVSEQKNIFGDFYRIGDESTREAKGSGLGLAIVKRVADAHKASIILESAPGKGSTFTVVFKRN